jgi:beta-lactamase regulating signal transducer with metallopeptidase domain
MAIELAVWLGMLPRATAWWLALLLTYALHASLWAGAAAVCARVTRVITTRRSFWLLALFGPLVTSGVSGAALTVGSRPALEVPILARNVTDSAAGAASPHLAKGPVLEWLVLGAVSAAALGSLRFGIAAFRVSGRLRTRRSVTDPRLLERLDRLRARVALPRLVLSESARIRSPVALGAREICVPEAWLDDLDEAEIDAILAHELAHLERRDGLWFPGVAFVQSLLWWQPLNHWVAARFRESAELACDDRAVELTGDRLALARALVRTAERALIGSPGSMAPAMAWSKAKVVARVRRLTRQPISGPAAASGLHSAGFAALGVAILALSVRVPSARLPMASHAVALAASPLAESDATESTLEASALGREVLVLAHREQQLSLALAEEEAMAADPETSARVLELRQEIRHVRENAVWLEERFTSALAARTRDPRAAQ